MTHTFQEIGEPCDMHTVSLANVQSKF